MNSWRVENISVEPMEAEDSHFFGINQMQSDADAEPVQGAFYTEVWSQKKSKRIAVDLDRSLPAADSYEPHMIQAREMPATNVWVNCFCTRHGEDDRLVDLWQEVTLPDAGWSGHMIIVLWSPKA